jgi:hypothetical protein
MQQLRNVKKIMLLTGVVEDVNEESTVVLIGYGIDGSIITLFDIVHLDVSSLVHSFENFVVFCERVAHYFEMLVFVVDDSHAFFRVVSDDHLDYIKLCVDECSQS